MNKELFINSLKEMGIAVTSNQLESLEKYHQLLVTWNKKMNLTSILDQEQVYLKHFYDSLTTIKIINLNEVNTVIDVGSGAGFPGIVLKIFYPQLQLDIIDSNNKKLIFLQEVINNLNLENVTLIHDRCENYALNNLDKYDLVVSRAVANLNTLTELCLPLVKVGGYFIALKGDAQEEIVSIKKELAVLHGSIEDIKEFLLPIENSKRTLIKIKKEEKSPIGYPRSFDKIKKKPL